MTTADMFLNDCPTEGFDFIVNQLDTSFCHVPGAIYNPWALKNTGKGNACESLPKDLALDASEKLFLSGFINALTDSMPTKDNKGIDYTHSNGVEYQVFFYRNPSNSGVNLRYGEYNGYYPDFIVYFMRKDGNGGTALLIDPKGLMTEFANDGLAHYKYMASTLTIAEINECPGSWQYVAGFASTSPIEKLKFIKSDSFNEQDEQTKKERYARMGIFFNDKMNESEYKKLIDWTLDENRFITQLVKQASLGVNTDVNQQTTAEAFAGGYIGLLAKTLMTVFNRSEQRVYSYIFNESFKFSNLVAFNNSLSRWENMRDSIGDVLEDNRWEGKVKKRFFKTEYDKLIELILLKSAHHSRDETREPNHVAHSQRADDSAK
jgi:hypothetical protein